VGVRIRSSCRRSNRRTTKVWEVGKEEQGLGVRQYSFVINKSGPLISFKRSKCILFMVHWWET